MLSARIHGMPMFGVDDIDVILECVHLSIEGWMTERDRELMSYDELGDFIKSQIEAHIEVALDKS